MKEKLVAFLHALSLYDLIYFAAVFLIFILLIILTLLLRKKLTLSLFILLIAILEIALAPTVGFGLFHNALFKKSITVTKTKKLQFVQAVFLEGKLKNESPFDFKQCVLEAKVFKETGNKYKDLILRLKPLKTKSITLKDIPKGADVTFKLLIEPFTYKKDINVSISGICQ